jgi:two-component system cell cycle sensor histidine kinase/response regulator CckA
MNEVLMEQGQPTTILGVDDEPGVLVVVRRCLDGEQVTVVEASSGKEVLERIAKGLAIDLLITDLQMPDMNGDELARQLRSAEPDLKVLYLTGHADGLFEAKPQLWEAEAYLDKPFTLAGLREAVALLLFGRMTPSGALWR